MGESRAKTSSLPVIQVDECASEDISNENWPASPTADASTNGGGSSLAPTLVESNHALEEAEALLRGNGHFSSGRYDGGEASRSQSAFMYTPEQMYGIIDPKNPFVIQGMGGLEGLEKTLVTNADTGLVDSQLTEQEIAARDAVYGKNELPERKQASLFKIILATLNDKVLIILIVAAIISLALGLYETFGEPPEYDEEGRKLPRVDWVEGVAILAAVVIVTLVGSINDWQKDRQFAKLNKKKENRMIEVLRNGNEMQVNVGDVVVGDVVMVQPGDMLAVDGVVLQSNDIQCDESSVTGESDTMKKTPVTDVMNVLAGHVKVKDNHAVDCMMISGSKVLQGSGKYLVTGVGQNSMFGRTMMSLNQGIEVTPLQEKLNRIADGIALFGLWSAVILFVVLFIRFLIEITHGRYKDVPGSVKGNHFMDIFIVAVTIVVVAVPEGLPLAVTLALAFATTRMIKDNCLVRVLKSCETMGGATTVCSDKTGTLTQNKMSVVAATVGPESWQDGEEAISGFQKDEQLLRDAIAVNSSVYEEYDNPEILVGSKTESALVGFARRFLDIGVGKLKDYRSSRPVAFVLPFDSSRKYMVTFIRSPNSKTSYRMHIKGAAEILLKHTTQLHSVGGEAVDIDKALDFLNGKIEDYANEALRPIAVAYKDFETSDDVTKYEPKDVDISNLTFLGIFGIKDPLRPGVEEAVHQCIRAGVVVRMVTGDNVRTARAIAINAGIISPDDESALVLEGPDFRKYSDEELEQKVPHLRVLARSSPQDKRRLVGILQKLGDTVAVTGDGTNDAPALRLADVGFSMGITGTEVAKEASDIVIMDDNFASIVNAIKWGRTVNDAVKKFLQFQLTVNVTAVTLTFVSAVANSDNESVLTAVQLLWVNLIMDTLAALALATDAPTDEVLDRKPDNRKVSLITPTMWKMIFGQAIYQLAVTFVLHFAGASLFGYHGKISSHDKIRLSAMVFNTFVWMQFFNMFVNRRLDNGFNLFIGLSKNYFFPAVALVIGGFQVLIMFVGGAAFSIHRQTGGMWATAIICGFVSIPVSFLIRLVPDEFVMKLYPRKFVNVLLRILDRANKGFMWLMTPASWLISKTGYCLKRVYYFAIRKPMPRDEDEEESIGGGDVRRSTTPISYSDTIPDYEWQPGIQKSIDDLQLTRRVRGARLRRLHFIGRSAHTEEHAHIERHRRFHRRRRQSNASTSASSLTALMAPFVVSGAVGGWSPGGSEQGN